MDDQGTLPSAPVMQYGHVEIVNVHISNNGAGVSQETTPLKSAEGGREEKKQVHACGVVWCGVVWCGVM